MKTFQFDMASMGRAADQFCPRYGIRGPEEQLMFAVLSDAVDCFQNCSHCVDGIGERLFFDAREWIFESNNIWPFSFQNICEALGLEPDYIRAGLLANQEKSVGQANRVAEKYRRRYNPRNSRPTQNGARIMKARIPDGPSQNH